MFRPAAARSLLRRHVSCSSCSSTTALLLRRPAASTSRLLSTSAAPKKRSTLKGTAARWALAGGIVYWYTTSAVFADEPKYREERPAGPTEAETDRPASLLPTTPLRRSKTSTTRQGEGEGEGESAALAAHSRAAADELEEEASQEGAFNPETGEINWDCPCLGGMAHGPCGDEFKAAFSCFVFSSEDPKGVDCIERFKDMQACFQQHPDVYGSELDDDNDSDDDDLDTAGPGSSETGSGRPDQPPIRSTAAATSSTSGSAATTGTAPASTGTAPASTGTAPAATGRAPPPEVTERTTAPSLAEPSASVADTPVLQSAHRGDARARSSSDPPTEREAAVAAEDAPRRRG
ncbi:hypothetical protein DFP73DRAFT_501907 [Morchella snyderi]|nr:hypothetical protein DFP73DRAFT_501907 [Morchella snyderi]